jgi:hypothetical protein
MAKPRVGGSYTYSGSEGFGQAARRADPSVPDEMSVVDGVNMAWLDMAPGTVVKVAGHDDDRDLVLLEWVDDAGTTRITSVTEDQFADFTKGA